MLTKLTVQNFALISFLELKFGEKLNILSGETGAGKSILVDCIMLLTGGRYDKSMLRFGESMGFVEGVFDISDDKSGVFSDYAEEGETELIVLRKFSADGKNEIKINGRSVNLTMLKAISGHLIDICGQNEHQSLANVANHIKIVDYYARHSTGELLSAISEDYRKLREIDRAINEIGDAKSRARNLDVYKFQLDEINRAKINEGEEEELTSTRKRYLGAEKICYALSTALNALSEGTESEGSATDLLSEAESSLNGVSGFDARYEEWISRLKSAIIEVEDISDSLADELNSLDFSPAELDDIEKRLDVIRGITRKYGDYKTVCEYKADLIKKIDEIENAEEHYEKLLKHKKNAVEKLYRECVTLSEERKKAAKELGRLVVKELSELGMAGAEFDVNFAPLPEVADCDEKFTSNGLDSVEFYLSTNAGQPLKPLIKIISGGELSRLMLALKVVSSGIDDTPTVIFDEIDTGISGKVGQEVAKKLARLAQKHQLLCVTHLPQIASMADEHFFIDKYSEKGQTYTRVTPLCDGRRIDEIARLSGGKDISTQAGENAAQMKQWSDNYKKSLS